MTSSAARLRRGPETPRATSLAPLELLFDVVFVLALTQLSHLLRDMKWSGVVQALILLLPLAMVWNTNKEQCDRFDPATTADPGAGHRSPTRRPGDGRRST